MAKTCLESVSSELSRPCLKVSINEALERNDYGRIIPGDDDADHDGRSNLDEFTQGTDPCVSDAPAAALPSP